MDDKSGHCIPFILDRLAAHRQYYESIGELPPPLFLGLNGIQGAGKTTLVSTLSKTLSSSPHNLPVVVLSIDDLYLPHEQQEALARAHPDNPLVQHRGEPSTHDVETGVRVFDALAARQTNVRIPSYDKSRFGGAGDRRPEREWAIVNAPGAKPVEVVVFEGWCVGFRALADQDVRMQWEVAKQQHDDSKSSYNGQLGTLKVNDVMFVNDHLRAYDALTDRLGAVIHIDAADTQYVYHWRQEQEASMRALQGTGMTEDQVINFVNGYYPAYELYTENLRKGIFEAEQGKQMRIVVGRDRRVKEVFRI